MNTEKQIGQCLQAVFANRCVACEVRYKAEGSNYCDYCRNISKRGQSMTPWLIEKTVIDLVEPKYANATMGDIEPEIRNQLRDRETWQDVFFYGPPGVGKTYTMAALIRAYTGAGYKCMRSSFDEFCCRIRSTMSPGSKTTEWDMSEELKSVDLLFIDDLGLRSEPESSFVYQTFFLILNKRQERLLPTFISSNKDLDRLQETLFDIRIISRLKDALIIEMTGEDRRNSERIAPVGANISSAVKD